MNEANDDRCFITAFFFQWLNHYPVRKEGAATLTDAISSGASALVRVPAVDGLMNTFSSAN